MRKTMLSPRKYMHAFLSVERRREERGRNRLCCGLVQCCMYMPLLGLGPDDKRSARYGHIAPCIDMHKHIDHTQHTNTYTHALPLFLYLSLSLSLSLFIY